MATYSSFFSSGLLAPRIARCTTPVLPSSPMAIPPSPVDPIDCQLSPTPTQLGQTSQAPEAHRNAESSRVRRRRSSINVGSSPMALIKSPVRNAGAALQRTGLLSPTRHRAASVNMNDAFESNSIFGRLRSGSVGGAANPPMRLRRAIRRPVPLAPPPSVPLPAPPLSPSAKCGSSLLPPAVLVPAPRQPLTARGSRTDNVGKFFPTTLPSPTLLNTDFAKMAFELSPGFSGSRDFTADELMENA